ncbi:MAG: hypothetical protein U0165_09675 [Polyangiaceae bacterium]
MTARCAAGHLSDEPDYCSVCGAKIGAPVVSNPPPQPTNVGASVGSATSCPVCGERRHEMSARFCEVCRYDFATAAPRASSPPAQPSAVPATQAAAPARVSPAPSEPNVSVARAPLELTQRWELIVTIDPSLDTEPEPGVVAPKDPPRVFPIEIAEMLVGRRDDQQNVRPAVPLHDPGASRRHAKFLLNTDGTISLSIWRRPMAPASTVTTFFRGRCVF